MPTCPGCHQPVEYDQLETHLHHCHALRRAKVEQRQSVQRLERHVDDLDRQIERRLQAIETAVGTAASGDDAAGEGTWLLERDS